MEQTDSARLRKAIMEVIHNQVRDKDPPETGRTIKRLRQQGFSEKETLKLVGCVVASEVFGILKENKLYDQERYIAALKRLPKLPWEEGA
jgi:peroxiredoxin family protein